LFVETSAEEKIIIKILGTSE